MSSDWVQVANSSGNLYWVNTASGSTSDTDPNSVSRVSAFLAGGSGSSNAAKIAEYNAKLVQLQAIIDKLIASLNSAPGSRHGSGSGSRHGSGSGPGSGSVKPAVSMWVMGAQYDIGDLVIDFSDKNTYICIAPSNTTEGPGLTPTEWQLYSSPPLGIPSFPQWSTGASYTVNTAVLDATDNNIYLSILANNSSTPPSLSRSYWRPYWELYITPISGSGSGSVPVPSPGSGSVGPATPLSKLLLLKQNLINAILRLGGSVTQPGSNVVGTTSSFGTRMSGTPIPFRGGSRTHTPPEPDPGDVLQAPLPPQGARGTITTLLDLVDRDQQENDLFPISTGVTWFARDVDRRLLPFTSTVQEVALRGPAAFAQRFTFDLGSIVVGDLLLGTALQIRLDHWLDEQTRNIYAAKRMFYSNPSSAWEYANGLGAIIIQSAELEIDGVTVETIDGDFINVYNTLFNNYGAQLGVAYDHIGLMSMTRLMNPARLPATYPVENGLLTCPLPFFFGRAGLKEALPMTAIREGHVKINITLRPFQECVRIMSGKRSSCDATPLNTEFEFAFPTCTWTFDSYQNSGNWDVPPPFSFSYTAANGISYNWSYNGRKGVWANQLALPANLHISSSYTWNPAPASWQPAPPPFNIAFFDPVLSRKIYYWDGAAGWRTNPTTGVKDIPSYTANYGSYLWKSVIGDWSVAPPPFKSVTLLSYGAVVEGELRSRMLRNPFEILHRELQTFYFQEPMKYSVGAKENIVKIQLPLEANHPIEEIIWFVRRKAVQNNNEWTNYSSVVESEFNAHFPVDPLLDSAAIQINGTVLCEADEQFFRQSISAAHKGGFASYSRFIYGYSFAKHPGEHQPSGSINASRVNSLRLTLNVKPPAGLEDSSWEVKVFCIALNWMRFENGLANAVFED